MNNENNQNGQNSLATNGDFGDKKTKQRTKNALKRTYRILSFLLVLVLLMSSAALIGKLFGGFSDGDNETVLETEKTLISSEPQNNDMDPYLEAKRFSAELVYMGEFDAAIVYLQAQANHYSNDNRYTELIAAYEAQRTDYIVGTAEQYAEKNEYRFAIAFLDDAWDTYGEQIYFDLASNYRMQFGQYGNSIVAAGKYNTALILDGDAYVVGENDTGELNANSWTNVVALGLGDQYIIGLHDDGTVSAIGQYATSPNIVAQTSGWKNVVSISAGDTHAVGLTANGRLLSLGYNGHGQTDVHNIMQQAGDCKIVAISAGYTHTLALLDNGSVLACGSNSEGACNVSGWSDVVAIYTGSEYSAALISDGTVKVTGKNDELFDSSDWTDIVSLAAGDYFLIGLKSDGTLVSAALDRSAEYLDAGQLEVSELKDIVHIAAGHNHIVALDARGILHCIGRNSRGACDVNGWHIRNAESNMENTVACPNSATPSWILGYETILETSPLAKMYTLYDIDLDGVPELFVKEGTSELDYDYNVYRFSSADANTVRIGTFSGYHTSICGVSDENAFLTWWQTQGYEQIDKYTLEDGKLTEERIFASRNPSNHNLVELPFYQVDERDCLYYWSINPPENNLSESAVASIITTPKIVNREGTVSDTVRVWVTVNNGWDNVSISANGWAYSGEHYYWPGGPMTESGKDVYYCDVPSWCESIRFSTNGFVMGTEEFPLEIRNGEARFDLNADIEVREEMITGSPLLDVLTWRGIALGYRHYTSWNRYRAVREMDFYGAWVIGFGTSDNDIVKEMDQTYCLYVGDMTESGKSDYVDQARDYYTNLAADITGTTIEFIEGDEYLYVDMYFSNIDNPAVRQQMVDAGILANADALYGSVEIAALEEAGFFVE